MRVDELNRVLIDYHDIVPTIFTVDVYNMARKRGAIQTTHRGGRGRSVEVIYDSLSNHYKQLICKTLGDPMALTGLSVTSKERVPFSRLTPKELQVCNARYNLVNCYRDYCEANKEKGIVSAKREYVELCNDGILCCDAVEIVGKVSFSTLEKWNKLLNDNNNIMDCLAPERRESKGSSLLMEHQQLMTELFCSPNAYSVASCYRIACGVWRSKGISVPTEISCRRFLEKWAHENASIAIFKRKGMKALKDNQLPTIMRDPNSLEFMDVIVADGRKMDFSIVHPDTGKSCRPIMVAWQDMRTKLILGFELMLTENTMGVVSSFRQACLNAGALCGFDGAVLPRSVYMDNGRAFKNKILNEEIDLKSSIGGLFERLKEFGLEHVQYAKPYNASSKVIERSFADFGELDKLVSSYCGNSITNKPARMLRNEIWHKNEYEKAVNKHGTPTLWGAYTFIEWWVGNYNRRISNGKYLNGKSPITLAASQIPDIDFTSRLLPSHELDYMMLNTKVARLKRNGFNINGTWYYNALFSMVAKGGDVEYIVKYDILKNDKVLVYHEDGTYWCEATTWIGQQVHGMAALGSEADRAKLNNALTAQRQIEKSVVSAAISMNSNNALILEEINHRELLNAPAITVPVDADVLTDLKYF